MGQILIHTHKHTDTVSLSHTHTHVTHTIHDNIFYLAALS
jgi:hypothetical protein